MSWYQAARYRHKPVEIEAYRLTNINGRGVAHWCSGTLSPGGARVTVNTPTGRVTARQGDWIIQNADGEYYRCKPEIFEATYEPVGEPVPTTS
jgi:hypothetical protein